MESFSSSINNLIQSNQSLIQLLTHIQTIAQSCLDNQSNPTLEQQHSIMSQYNHLKKSYSKHTVDLVSSSSSLLKYFQPKQISAFPRPHSISQNEQNENHRVNLLKHRISRPMPSSIPPSTLWNSHSFQTPNSDSWMPRAFLDNINTSIAYFLLYNSTVDSSSLPKFPYSPSIQNSFHKVFQVFCSEARPKLDPTRIGLIHLSHMIPLIFTDKHILASLKQIIMSNAALLKSFYIHPAPIAILLDIVELVLDINSNKSHWSISSRKLILLKLRQLNSSYFDEFPAVSQLVSIWIPAIVSHNPKNISLKYLQKSYQLLKPWLEIGQVHHPFQDELYSFSNNQFSNSQNQYKDTASSSSSSSIISPTSSNTMSSSFQAISNKTSQDSIHSIFDCPTTIEILRFLFRLITKISFLPYGDLLSLVIHLGSQALPSINAYYEILSLQQSMGHTNEENQLESWDTSSNFLQCGLERNQILKFHSVFVCPVSQGTPGETQLSHSEITRSGIPGSVSAPEQVEIPYMLPCGHILSGRTIVRFSRRKIIKCAYCPWKGATSACRQIVL